MLNIHIYIIICTVFLLNKNLISTQQYENENNVNNNLDYQYKDDVSNDIESMLKELGDEDHNQDLNHDLHQEYQQQDNNQDFNHDPHKDNQQQESQYKNLDALTDEEILRNLQIIEDEIDAEAANNIPPNQGSDYSSRNDNKGKSRILMVPSIINSHVLFFGQLGRLLAELGHDVEILVASAIPDIFDKIKHRNLGVTRYASRNESMMSSDHVSSSLLSIALSNSTWYQFYKLFTLEQELEAINEEDCRSILYNRDLMLYLEGERYEFVVMDAIAANCYFLLPLKLDVPFGVLSIPFMAAMLGVPRLPSVTPFIGTKFTDRMSFYERLSSLLQETLFYLSFSMPCRDATHVLPSNIPHPVDVKDMFARASAWFIFEDLSVTYPSAKMPNTVSMGAIASTSISYHPLPSDLEAFLMKNNEGTIIVSFGSYFDNVPENIGNVFCSVFRSRPQNKIVWKMKYTPAECVGLSNLMIVKWLPQVDLLAHAKTKLFMTHGGLNSIIEALHHEVVMIVIPIAMDQITNAAAVENKGYAISMQLGSENLESELADNIDLILTDESFRVNIKKYSKLLREKKISPQVEVSNLIDHIVEFGDEHLRSSSIGMHLLQLYMVDIFLFLFGVFFVALALVVLVVAFWCKRFQSKALKEKIKTS